MEKTPQEITAAVLAYCHEVCPPSTNVPVTIGHVTLEWIDYGTTMNRGLRLYGVADWMYIDESMGEYVASHAYRLLGLDKRDALEAAREKIATLEQQLEEAKNVTLKGMETPAWAMFGELTKFMEEVTESDSPRSTSWCIRLEDGEEVTLMNIWAATSHDSPITRATELRDMLQQVLNHSKRPEMDDAQFRMFARENINHLLYGSREGKKDE